MNRANRTAATLLTLLASSLFALNVAAFAADEPPEVSHDGLQLVKSKKLDLVYVRPGATLSGYTKVAIDPVEVAFDKKWEPDPRAVDDEDRERIRSELADEFQKVFTKELQEKGGYQIVNTAGPDVLRVTAAIIDLYITAPDASSKTAGRVNSYVISAGSMTLVAELRDSQTGAILARVADRKGGRETGPVQWATSTSNRAAARSVLAGWARILRDALDDAKSPG
jgi:Protein of unknown function (DUF3313)